MINTSCFKWANRPAVGTTGVTTPAGLKSAGKGTTKTRLLRWISSLGQSRRRRDILSFQSRNDAVKQTLLKTILFCPSETPTPGPWDWLVTGVSNYTCELPAVTQLLWKCRQCWCYVKTLIIYFLDITYILLHVPVDLIKTESSFLTMQIFLVPRHQHISAPAESV